MHHPVEDSAAMQRATLRITGGLSIEVGSVTTGRGVPQLITIGASPRCDWQIRAPDVAQHAMLIGVIEGVLYAASGPDSQVTVNGCPLSEAWYKVTGRAVFRLGAAELELSWNERGDSGELGAEVRLAPETATGLGDSTAHLPGGGARLPSLLEPTAEPTRGASLIRVAGFLLFATVSYFAWLVLLDHV